MERVLAQHPSYTSAVKFEATKFRGVRNLTTALQFGERFRPVTRLHLAEHTLRQRIDDLSAYLNQPGVREWEEYPIIYRWVYRNPIRELATGRLVLRQIPIEFDLIPAAKEEAARNLRQTLNRMIDNGEIKNKDYKWFIPTKNSPYFTEKRTNR